MAHFTFMCCSSPLNLEVLFYGGHGTHFDDNSLNILSGHNIQSFLLKAGDYMHDHQNSNGQKTKFKNFYGNAIINWMRHNITLRF